MWFLVLNLVSKGTLRNIKAQQRNIFAFFFLKKNAFC
jgi:hypothetical protein